MNIHVPTPSLLDHVCGKCGCRDSDPTWHPTQTGPVVAPRRESEPVAVARRTDPSTSWEAARSVTGIRESQQQVLDLFRAFGPMTDEAAYTEHRRYSLTAHIQSVSGFRTRRSELVARGLLQDSGERRVGSTGRRMIVWRAA